MGLLPHFCGRIVLNRVNEMFVNRWLDYILIFMQPVDSWRSL